MPFEDDMDCQSQDNPYYDDENRKAVMPFQSIDKTSTLQLCRVFDVTPLDVEACEAGLIQVLYLIYTGETLKEEEATDLFFLSTRLFQSDHPTLRRMHYVLLKELAPLVERSFFASNSILQDIKNSSSNAKSHALRTLYAVMDSEMYTTMDRTIVECLTSQHSTVAMSALVTGIHIASTHPEIPKKWSTQLTELMNSGTKLQYACIALQRKLRKSDKLLVGRFVGLIKNGQIHYPLAVCSVIKICVQALNDGSENSFSDIYNFFKGILQSSSSDMVAFEASRAICTLRNPTSKELSPVVMVLRLYLNSLSPVLRFAAIRQLNLIAASFPEVVASINGDIEALMLDPNRMVATLAITALLRTGTDETIEHFVEKLLTQDYTQDLGNQFTLVVVHAICTLNMKFPKKYTLFLPLLLKFLTGVGSKELKETVLNTMIRVAEANAEAKDSVMKHLVEYIDDCEYSSFTKRVLSYLGNEVADSKNSRKFVRYICNHITLDAPDIRIGAVSALAKIAARIPSLRPPILTQFRKLAHDSDDEVRERAMLYNKLFLTKDEQLINTHISDVASMVSEKQKAQVMRNTFADHQHTPGANGKPSSSRIISPMTNTEPGLVVESNETHLQTADAKQLAFLVQAREELRKIKQLCGLAGDPAKTTEPVTLTEPDNEYIVSVVKHIYPEHLVLQFAVRNTMEDVSFSNVNVCADTSDLEQAEPLYAIPIEEIKPGETRYSYIVLRYTSQQFPSGHIECSLQFQTFENASEIHSGLDEYSIEGLDILLKDFVLPATDLSSEELMQAAWEREEGNETAGTYAVPSIQNLSDASRMFAEFYGMQVINGVPDQIKSNSHTLLMAGRVTDKQQTLLLVRMRVFVTSELTIALHLALRGGPETLRHYFADTLLS